MSKSDEQSSEFIEQENSINSEEAAPSSQGQSGTSKMDSEDNSTLSKTDLLENTVTLDEYKRLYADFLNYKRRAQSDILESLTTGERRVLEDILPLLDFMEMFLSSNDPHDNNFKYLFSVLTAIKGKYSLEVYGEVGQEFNPSLHDALESGQSEQKTITKIFSRGYTHKDKVIRIAVVGVD